MSGMTEPVLHLFGDSLLSKWGFGDGDMPDHVADEVEAAGLPYSSGDWHATLCRLVRERLIPALSSTVELVEIETAHNPIRASKVGGEDVEHLWTASLSDTDMERRLSEHVAVPMADVLTAYRAESQDAQT